MLRKLVIALLLAALLVMAGCHAKVQNPIANLNSKQPDKVLFDRAMNSMKGGRYPEARTLLETLISTYPDSEYVARAKLSVGDSWYAEGGTAGLQQAEVEYKDFITFFPNMPEAAEAQLKVANIHYKQMEKPDRDYNQAMRAADEYKALIQQFPDSKLLPQAKQRLREVQEVLAERQWRIARFYFLRNNFAASQARLTSLVNSYPLYSGADEALFMLGNIYEREANAMRMQKKLPEGTRAKMSTEYDQKAIDAYTQLINRYPVMLRADDARRRLQAMKAPVPTPTAQAIAQNQAEEDSRGEITRFHELVGNFRKHPDVSKTSEVGDPNLQEEEIGSAPALIQQLNAEIQQPVGSQQATIERVNSGTGAAPGPNQPAPASTNSQPASGATNFPATSQAVIQGATPNSSTSTNAPAAGSTNDLPVVGPANSTGTTVAPAAGTGNGATGNPAATNPGTPPKQINEISNSDSSGQNATQTPQSGQDTSDQNDSSSKKKKKKHKLLPF